jgi:hypothetical protein
MHIYRSQVPRIASDTIASLRKDHDIEVDDESVADAEKDLVAILEEYLRKDAQITEQAKDLADSRRLNSGGIGRIKKELQEQYEHPTGDDAVRFLVGQFAECFMQSNHVSEVFSDDVMLRRKINEVFKRHMINDDVLDQEVRGRIKNLQEGTDAWSIQYQKVMREVRKKHGIF